MDSTAKARPVRERWWRSLLVLGVGVTVLGVLHHVDHVVRGNHSGWPFQEEVTPFTFSLLIYALLLPGIYMNLRGRVVAVRRPGRARAGLFRPFRGRGSRGADTGHLQGLRQPRVGRAGARGVVRTGVRPGDAVCYRASSVVGAPGASLRGGR